MWQSAEVSGAFFSLVNCLLELLHPEITPLDCAVTKYEVENALGSPLNHGVAESRPPVHCQWNTFRLNYIVSLVLAALPSALEVTAPPGFCCSYFALYTSADHESVC